jgi:hypothetical protein
MAATLKIIRKGGYVNILRPYTVFVDGISKTPIYRNETKEINIAEGTHTVICKIDWCTSNEVSFIATDGQEIIVEVGSLQFNFLTIGVQMLYYLTIGRKKYLWLKMLQTT